MTANAWCTSFFNCSIWFVICLICILAVASASDARTVRFLSSILFNRVRALVPLDGGVSAGRVLDLVLGAVTVVLIAGFVLALYFSLLFSFGCR